MNKEFGYGNMFKATKMREIKFRALRSDKYEKEFVYGNLLKHYNYYFILTPADIDIYDKDMAHSFTIEHLRDEYPYNPFLSDYYPFTVYPVRKESIQQFCGYDKNGGEIYEGDTVTDGEDNYKVSLDDVTLRFEDNFRIGSAQISKFVKVDD